MKTRNMKKGLCYLLTAALMIGLMPVSALGEMFPAAYAAEEGLPEQNEEGFFGTLFEEPEENGGLTPGAIDPFGEVPANEDEGDEISMSESLDLPEEQLPAAHTTEGALQTLKNAEFSGQVYDAEGALMPEVSEGLISRTRAAAGTPESSGIFIMSITDLTVRALVYVNGLNSTQASNLTFTYDFDGAPLTPSIVSTTRSPNSVMQVITFPAATTNKTLIATPSIGSALTKIIPAKTFLRIVPESRGLYHYSEVENRIAYTKFSYTTLVDPTVGPIVDVVGDGNLQTTFAYEGWRVSAYANNANLSVLWDARPRWGTQFIEVSYYLYNPTSTNISASLALDGDIMIGSNDNADVYPLLSDNKYVGLTMSDGGDTVALINLNQGKYGGETAPNWWGHYGDRAYYRNDDENTTDALTDGWVDSAAVAKVRGITLAPGELREYSILIGAGSTDEIFGTINDIASSFVAKIGDQYYATLAEAVAAAQTGQTITMLKDVVENITVNKSITIDGTNQSFAPVSITVNGNCTVTLKNINFPGSGPNNITLQNDGKLTLGDTSVINARVKVGVGSHINVNGTGSPNVTLDVSGAANGQVIVSSTNATPPDANKFSITGGTGVGLAAEGTHLKLGKIITLTFPGTTGGNGGAADKWTFIATGTNTFGSALPPPPSGQVWKDTAANKIINANTLIPTVVITIGTVPAESVYPVKVTINTTSYFFESLSSSAVAYDDQNGLVDGMTLNSCLAGTTAAITLYDDIKISAPFVLPAGCTVTLLSANDGKFSMIADNTMGTMITIPVGAKLTVGILDPGPTGSALNGVNFNGGGHVSDTVIVNNGTLKLYAGSIITGKTSTYAVKHQNNGDSTNPLTYDGANFRCPDVIFLDSGTEIFSVGRPRFGDKIIVELHSSFTAGDIVVRHEGFDEGFGNYADDPNGDGDYNDNLYNTLADSLYGRYSNTSGTIYTKNAGLTLTQQPGSVYSHTDTGGEPMIVSVAGNIAAMRPGSDIDEFGILEGTAGNRRDDGYTYGYPSLNDILGHHGLYGTPGNMLYVVADTAVNANTTIPAVTFIKGADRMVSGVYGTDITIENRGGPSVPRYITIGTCLVKLEPNDSSGSPLLNYAKAIDDVITKLRSQNSYSPTALTEMANRATAAKSSIGALVPGTATYGELADILTNFYNAVSQVSSSVSRDSVRGNHASITVSPADSKFDYGLVDASGNALSAPNDGWKIPSGSPLAVTFSGLTAGMEYRIVTKATNAAIASPAGVTGGMSVVTAPEEVTGIVRADSSMAGKDKITFSTSSGREYAVYDKSTGVLVTGGSWTEGNGSVRSVDNLDPNAIYEVRVRMRSAADGKIYLENATTVPGSFDVTGVYTSGGETQITIDPTMSGKEYVLVSTDVPQTIIGRVDGQDNTAKTIMTGALSPGTVLKLVAVDKGTSDNDIKNTADSDGFVIVTPVANVPSGQIGTAIDKATGKSTITIGSIDNGKSYAIIDPDTGKVVTGLTSVPANTDGWTTDTNGGTITFGGLIAGKAYEVVTIPNPMPVGTTTDDAIYRPGTSVVTDFSDVTGKYISEANTQITIDPTASGYKYAVVDADGNVAGSGWVTGTTGQPKTFTGLPAGTEYRIVIVEAAATPDANTLKNMRGRKIVTPVANVPSGAITTSTNKAAVSSTITISPTDRNKSYALIDSDTGKVITGVTSTPANAAGWATDINSGAITFSGLIPGKAYEVVAIPNPMPTGTTTDRAVYRPGTTVVTNFSEIKKEYIASLLPATAKISISPTSTGAIYAIVDGTGDVVTNAAGNPVWLVGTGSALLVFDGLRPGTAYTIVSLPVGASSDDKDEIGANTPGIKVTTPENAFELTGRVIDQSSVAVPGASVKVVVNTMSGQKTLEATTGPDGTYRLTTASAIETGSYTVYVYSATKGVSTQAISYAQKGVALSLNDIAVVHSQPNNIFSGIITQDGQPVSGQAVTILNKQTGGAASPNPMVAASSDAGSYVVSGLADGTYIIQTSGGGMSGMTEIAVENGVVKPNTKGGYTNVNIARSKGSFVSGQITGLASGKTATVTITVPVYRDTGAGAPIIGSKTLTAVAEGTGGYYWFAGVDNGNYDVTISNESGRSTAAAITVTAPNGSAGVTALPGSGDLYALRGVMLNQNGAPLSGAAITVYNDSGQKMTTLTASTGQGGGYTILLPADKTNLPDGRYYISADKSGNGLTIVEIKDGKISKGQTNITVDTTVTNGKLLIGTVSDSALTIAAGATVVVRGGNGISIDTTTTNSKGVYFVANVPDNATVSVTTANNQTGKKGLGAPAVAVRDGNITTALPGANFLSVIGPDGAPLMLTTGAFTALAANVTVEDSAGAGVTTGFIIDADGKLDVTNLTGGAYTITVEQNGMSVTKTINVSNSAPANNTGTITGDRTFKITAYTLKGMVAYMSAAIPADAKMTITDGTYTWGGVAINQRTGEFTLAGIPSGTYTAVLTVMDTTTAPAISTAFTTTLKVSAGGQIAYGAYTAVPTNGMGVTTSAAVSGSNTPKLTIAPSTNVNTVISSLESVRTELNVATIQAAISNYKKLTPEEQRQVSASLVKEVSDNLANRLTSSNMTVGANANTSNRSAVISALENQRGMLLSSADIAAATGGTTSSVAINLTLTANNVTDDPSHQGDVDKAETVATTQNAQIGQIFDISILKTTTTTVTDSSSTSTASSEEFVTSVPQDIAIELPIPGALSGYDYFAMVRVHDGKAERLPSETKKRSGGATISFLTNKFSTYALLVSNEPIFIGDEAATTVPADPTRPLGSSGSSGGGSSGGAGNVSITKPVGGSVTTSPASPVKGDQVTITIKPDAGYVLGRLLLTDANGNTVRFTDNGDDTYTYTQPDGRVTIAATFVSAEYAGDSNVSGLLNTEDHMAYVSGRGNSCFAPQEGMTRAEVAQMFYNLLRDKNVTITNGFSDVKSDVWYAKAVNTLASLGIITGFTDGTYKPNESITRAQMATITVKFAELSQCDSSFGDVLPSHWAYAYINTAASYGWVTGVGDGRFEPDRKITRAEAVTLVNKMLGRIPDKVTIDADTTLARFSDVTESHWAYYAIMEAANAHDYEKEGAAEIWK